MPWRIGRVERHCQNASDQSDNGSDRQIDSFGHDHKRNADADNPKQGCPANCVFDIAGFQKRIRGHKCGERTDRKQQSGNPEDFFVTADKVNHEKPFG